jgi:predicted DNA-binding protein (MmcQ/YjbR family)
LAKLQSLKGVTDYLGAKPGASSSYPFGPGALVFKVGNKMFALLADDESPLVLNLKCDPDEALALRAAHGGITGAYHMNKKHWNSVVLDGSISDSLVREMIEHSYELVVASLSKAKRDKLLEEGK